MHVGEAIADLGIASRDDAEILLVEFNGHGPRHLWLADVANRDLESFHDLYLASGAYPRDAIRDNSGRTVENARWVWWLPFDADLKDYLAADRAGVLALSDAEIAAHCERLQTDLEEIFAALGLPLHRLDYTGHGLCAYVRLDDSASPHVARLQAVHKAIVGRINALAGFRLVDPGVSDPGARITRVPGSWNHKAADAGLGPKRATRTLYQRAGAATAPELGRIAKGAHRPPERLIPDHGKGLADADVEALIEALAPHWTPGARHELALALAGLLAKGGIPEEQAATIVGRLSAGDEEPGDRAKAVATSYARVRSGLETRGFMGLRAALPAELLTWLDTKVQAVGAATRPRILVSGQRVQAGSIEPEQPTAPMFSPVPEAALRGWVGEYATLMEPTTEAPVCYHLGVGLVLAGAMLGRRAWVYNGRRVHANLYVLLVGPTGRARKDTAMDRLGELLTLPYSDRQTVSPEFERRSDVTSAEGLIMMLAKHENTTLVVSEMSVPLRRARRQSTGTLLTYLIKAYDAPIALDHPSLTNPLVAHNPYLSFLAATTPEMLGRDMTDEEVVSGFANRFLYFFGVATEAKASPPKMDAARAESLIRRLRDTLGGYGTAEGGSEVAMSPEAKARWDEWYVAFYHREYDSEAQRHMVQRYGTNIHKVALIYAVTDGRRAISREDMDAAIALVEWSGTEAMRQIETWGQTEDARLEDRIVYLLRAKGPLPRRTLQQRIGRKLGSGVFVRVLEAMAKARKITEELDGCVHLILDDGEGNDA